MSDLSRRKFLKASVVGATAATAVSGSEGCGGDGAAPPAAPPSNPSPSRPTPSPMTGSPSPSPSPSPTTGGQQPPMTNPPGTGGSGGQQPPTTMPTQPPGMQPPPPGMMMPPPMGPMPPSMMGSAGMPMRAVGNTGLMVSIVGFGSGSQYLRATEADADKIIQRAIELGVTYFDTAASYGNGASEKRLGKYLVPMHRNKITLVSKSLERSGEAAKREIDLTLKNLGTDKLDILHFHELASTTDTDRIMAKGGAYEVYRSLKEQGVIRFIGLTGHSNSTVLIDALTRIKPDVMMCPQNAARESGFTDMVIPFAQKNGIGLLGMKVTAQDALIRGGVKAEDLVKYSLSLPVSAMIIGMRSLTVLESCASIARGFKPLTPMEMMQITGSLASLDPRRCLPYRRWGYRDGLCWA
jgi:uncharacterized protein